MELPTAADGGWLITGARRRVALRWIGLGRSILLLGLAGINNTKNTGSTGRLSRQRQPTDVRGGEHWSERLECSARVQRETSSGAAGPVF